ncbi:MAG: GMP synthase [glutamine-hydrolyzing] subunit A [Methanonatronarchaeales archaeon]|nr:GMP synthase [glutamine-hydrolyzing] subunit A [Methanonatronarchaeales archaeon]
MQAVLGLEDGTIVEGTGIGVEGEALGELVFATPFTGYTESLTDPSYLGQLLMFSYPLVGNYGVSGDVFQSDSVKAETLVAREVCEDPSGGDMPLHELLERDGVPGIQGVDTRALTVRTREKGAMRAALLVGESDGDRAVRLARKQPPITELDLVREVSTPGVVRIEGTGPTVALLDMGTKRSIPRNLSARGCDVVIYPHDTPYDRIAADDPDALLISNGPGDPARCTDAVETASDAAGQVPLFGICFGHQIVSLALGGETYKLKFGHRGANQPVKHLDDGRVRITSQNHGFAVREEELPGELEMTAKNVNDDTVEGVRSEYLGVETVQYHPEAYPGPRDTESEFFDALVERCGE